MNHEKVEVSAILEADGFWRALAIDPTGEKCYIYSGMGGWRPARAMLGTPFDLWQRRAYTFNTTNRRIFRGIFTIKVATYG